MKTLVLCFYSVGANCIYKSGVLDARGFQNKMNEIHLTSERAGVYVLVGAAGTCYLSKP